MIFPRWLVLLLSITEGCTAWGCVPASTDTGPVTVESKQIYADELGQCVSRAQGNYDAGLECMRSVHAVFCSDGGVWVDAGVCNGPLGGVP